MYWRACNLGTAAETENQSEQNANAKEKGYFINADVFMFLKNLHGPHTTLLTFLFVLRFRAISWPFLSRYFTLRLRADAQSSVDSHRGGHLVVLYPNHHIFLHGQLGCLPHGGTNGRAHRLGGRPGKADKDRIRGREGRIHYDLLQGTAGVHSKNQRLTPSKSSRH